MSKQKLNEALARKQVLQKKKVVSSGNVSGWQFNDELELTTLGFKDKNRQPKMREYNSLDKMR